VQVRTPVGGAGGTEYSVTIWRQSDDSTLSNLLCQQPLTPAFSPTNGLYAVSVAESVLAWQCTPTRAQAGASIFHSLNQGAWLGVASNAAASRPVAVGDNRYEIKVVAEDPSFERFYRITVHRLSKDASLASLVPGSSSLSPAFGGAQLSYTMSLPSATAALTFVPAFAYTGVTALPAAVPATTATYTWNGVAGAAPLLHLGATPPLALREGDNYFTLRVRAEDSSTALYSVTVHRISADVRLSNLVMSPPGNGLTPPFHRDQLVYSVTVAESPRPTPR